MLKVSALLAGSLASAFSLPLQIKTTDIQKLAVANATIEARHTTTASLARCTTDAQGTCTLELAGPGEYRITGVGSGGDLEAIVELRVDNSLTATSIVLAPAALRTAVTVVSGSRKEELQEESATKVEAITQEQIERTGYERVSDLLQEIPGVLVRRGSTSTVGGEQIQGIDSRQVLVLQDGLPIVGARGIKSGALNLNRQSSGRMQRIEVAKGTSSSLYGSEAIGGVINMITKDPVELLEGGFLVSGGNLGMFDGRGDVGGRRGKGSFYLNAGHHRYGDYRLIPNSPSTVGPDMRRNDLLFKTRYQFAPKFSLGFTANAYHNREQGQNVSETGLVNGLMKDSTQTYALVADWILDSNTTFQARGYAARYDENNLTTPLTGTAGPSTANLNERLKRLDATLSRQIGSQHFLQGGAEWAQTQYMGANRVVGDTVWQQVTARDFWLQDKWTINPRVTFTAGGRVTNHSLFGSAAVPKAGLIVKLTDSWILRGSFGMGFRAPDLGQLYYRFANPASFYQVIGNPNLRPEYSQSWQTGALYRHRRYRLGVSLFRNNVRDIIDSRNAGTPRTAAELNGLLAANGIPPIFNPLLGRQTFIYFNLSRIYTQGVELDGEYSFNRQLRVSGSYTYLNALDKLSKLPLTQRHRHTGVVRADYVVPKLGIVANVRGAFFSHWVLNSATGTRGLPFQIWDAYISKDLPRGFQPFLALDNFNGSRDGKLQLPVPAFDRPDYGRTIRAGIRYRFGKEN